MNWLQAVLFGVVAGVSEFLPISSSAHKWILSYLFGVSSNDPVRNLVIHLSVLAALLFASRGLFETIRRERRMAAKGTKIYNNRYRGNMDYRLVRNAAIPMIIGYLVFTYILPAQLPTPVVVCMLLLNGIVLYLPSRLLQGNKDARIMSGFDSFLIGLSSAASAFTGISRIAMATSVGSVRGADRNHSVNWALLLSLPILILFVFLDVISLFSGYATVGSASFFGYLLIAVFAFIGAYFAVSFLRFLGVKTGFTAFSYYSWGAALFLFIIYLI